MTIKQKQDYLDCVINNDPIVKTRKNYRRNMWSGESITMDDMTTALVDYTLHLYFSYCAFVERGASQELLNDISEMYNYSKNKLIERNPKAYMVMVKTNRSKDAISKNIDKYPLQP